MKTRGVDGSSGPPATQETEGARLDTDVVPAKPAGDELVPGGKPRMVKFIASTGAAIAQGKGVGVNVATGGATLERQRETALRQSITSMLAASTPERIETASRELSSAWEQGTAKA
jgi:hypothetical protein